MPDPLRNRDVLIVIPCLNEERHLPVLLRQLLGEAHGALIVVADGGSTDRSRAIVLDLALGRDDLVLIDNPQQVQSAAVNLAARRFGAGRRWLVRVDAHAVYPEGYVDRLKLAAAAKGATSVVVPMVSAGEGGFQKAAAVAQNSVLGTGGAPHRHMGEGRWVDHGHHALFDLGLFRAVGGYDEQFAFNEDAELDRRLLAAGGRLWLEPLAAITYFPRGSIGALFRQYRNYGAGRARNLRRHPAPIKLRQALPLMIAPAVGMGLLGLVLAVLWLPALLMAVPMAFWLCATLSAGFLLGLQERQVCAAGAGLAAATMHLGWSLGYLEEAFRGAPATPLPQPLVFDDGAVVLSVEAGTAER